MKNHNILRRLLSITIVLSMMLSLCGCGSRRRPTSGRTPSSPSSAASSAASAATTSRRRKTSTPTGDLDNGDAIRSRRAAAAADASSNTDDSRRQGSSDDVRSRRRGASGPRPTATPTAAPEITRPTPAPSGQVSPTATPAVVQPTAAPAPSSLLQTVIDGIEQAKYPLELNCSYEEFMDVYEVISDDPAYFWIRGYQARYSSTHVTVYFIYTHDSEQAIDEVQRQIEQVAQEVLAGIDTNATTMEKVIYLHDWLLQNITYVSDGGWHDQTLYGALVQKQCVCAGISRAFTYLARRMGLDVDTVIGYASGEPDEIDQLVAAGDPNHAWNALTINGSTCYLDVTWDNTDRYAASNREYLMHSWLGVPFGEMIVTHVPDDPADELPTHTDAHNYFVYYHYDMPTFDYQQALQCLQQQKALGYTMLEMRFPTDAAYQAALNHRSELYHALDVSGGYSSNDELRTITFWT